MSKTLAHVPPRLVFLVLGCLGSHVRPGTPLDPAVIDNWAKLTARVVRVHPQTCCLSAGGKRGHPAGVCCMGTEPMGRGGQG